ncbi:MAG: hypothetical protein IRY85_16340 [Micromonosporaceae bacterium]|nr:hypothetical protein [Micromonosporaceae bacterium]
MAEIFGIAAVFGFFAAVVAGLYVMGRRIRTGPRRSGTAVISPFEEIWHPAAYRARQITEAVQQQVAPMPAPSDPPRREHRRKV